MQIADGPKKTGHILSVRGKPSEITTSRICRMAKIEPGILKHKKLEPYS